MALVPGGGQLVINGAEDPFDLQVPTTISGSIDTATGVITAGVFSTPTIALDLVVTSPVTAPVHADIVFTQNGPATGAIDADGNAFVSVSVNAHLDIEVGNPPFLVAPECVAGPVNLVLESTAPYDPETGRVTLSDPDFSVPAVVETTSCGVLIADGVNGLLGGGGHQLSLTLVGELPLPEPPGEPSQTTLAVVPAGSSRFGEPVTVTATVAPGEDAEETTVPTGFVDFFNGDSLVASTVALVDGAASITLDGLAAGDHSLTARYRGNEIYRRSTSPAVIHAVIAVPGLSSTLPATLRIGGPATPFDVTVTNTGFGGTLANARLDINLQRAYGAAVFTPDRVVLEYRDDQGDWQLVPLTVIGGALTGTVGSATGFPLPPGQELTQRLRITLPVVGTPHATACAAANTTCPGPVVVTFAVNEVVPGTGVVVSTVQESSTEVILTEASRRPSEVKAGTAVSPAVVPHTVRAGYALTLGSVNTTPVAQSGNVRPTGVVKFYIDDQQVPFRRNDDMPRPAEPSLELLVSTETVPVDPKILVPPGLPPGSHTVTIWYSGDAVFQPATATYPFTVYPAIGPAYECVMPAVTTYVNDSVSLDHQVLLPKWAPAGSVLAIDGFEFRVLTDRGRGHNLHNAYTVGSHGVGVGHPIEVAEFFLGPNGSVNVGSYERVSSAMPNTPAPAPVTEVDQRIMFRDTTGSVVIEGELGETVDVTVDRFVIMYRGASSVPIERTCTPVEGPVVLGQVRIAGTKLTVEPGTTVRAGRQVRLDAQVFTGATNGMVEFRDGTNTIGVVAMVDGHASMTTAALPEGTRQLTARFLGGIAHLATTSEPVELSVLTATECAAFAQDGTPAVVRLVYLELLGRCPDQAGFDYWTGRLDSGTSPEAFARTIAATPEAVGRVVDDGYQTMLGRPADSAGRTFWTGRLQGHGRYDTLLADLGASDEFWTKAGSTNEGFVTRVYDRLLNRTPDPAGLDYWVGRLNTGTSRRALILSLANLDEPLGVLVTQSYDEILARAPTVTETNTGTNHLRATGDRSALYAQLIGRAEFTQRAQSFPNPED